MKKFLFSPSKLIWQALPEEPAGSVVDLGESAPGEGGKTADAIKGETKGELGDFKEELKPAPAPAPDVTPAPAPSGGTIEPVGAEPEPVPAPVPAPSGGTIEPVVVAPDTGAKKTAKKVEKKEKAKEAKEKKEFPDEIYSFELSEYKEPATEKELEETYAALKKRLETDNDSNITIVVKGTADRVKFRVDKKDKNKVDLHLGDEKWNEWRTDFTGAVMDLVNGGKLEEVLEISADPNDPVKQAFDTFKAELFTPKGLEAMWGLPVDKQQTLMNHAIAYLRAEKLQKTLAEKFGDTKGVNFRIDTEWLSKKGGRISTIIGVEDWEEKPAVAPVPAPTAVPKGPEGAVKAPGRPAEVAKAVEVVDESLLVTDVENAVAISKVRAELDRASAAYSTVKEVMDLVEQYEMQLANLKEMALDAGDTAQLEVDLETLFQDWLNTFPGVLKAHDEKAKAEEAAKAAGVAAAKGVEAVKKWFGGGKAPEKPEKPAEAPREAVMLTPEAIDEMVAASNIRAELDRASAAYSTVKEVMDLVEQYEMQLANLKEMALDAGDTAQLEADLETLFQDWSTTFPGVLKAHEEKAKAEEAAKAAGVAAAKGVEAVKGWFGGGKAAPAEAPKEPVKKPVEEKPVVFAPTAPEMSSEEPTMTSVVPVEDEGDPIDGMLNQ